MPKEINDAPLTLWRYVPLKQFSKPPVVTTQAVRTGVSRAVFGFFNSRRPVEFEDTEFIRELESVPLDLLDKIVPKPDLKEPVAALSEVLKDWAEKPFSFSSTRCIVARPFSWTDQVITGWAEANGWHVAAEPSAGDIMSGGREWLAHLIKTREQNIVIPHLERFYLRHAEGFALMRGLMEWLWSEKCRVLIGCDSWAWAYLGKVFGVDAIFPYALTLDTFNHQRLKQWFLSLSTGAGKRTLTFRQADNHRPVLPLPEKTPDDSVKNPGNAVDLTITKKNTEQETGFMDQIATAGAGIPGVTWAIWRYCLQLLPDATRPDTDFRRTLWVKPWMKVSLPKVSAAANLTNLFVLHAVLLHGGLREDTLNEILPPSKHEISQSLSSMKADGLVEVKNDRWQVTALAYPSVRRFLGNEGYLTDEL